MSNFWLRMRVWAKVTLIVAVTVYALVFASKNSERTVKLWVFYNRDYEQSVLMMVLMWLAVGVIGTMLARTTLKTVRQVRELREKGRIVKMQRENADMKAKAAMLQTRVEAGRPEKLSGAAPSAGFGDATGDDLK
jgi:hypothetical protein